MNWLSVLSFGVIGLVIGSFLNVCADRLPAHESLIAPPSHCPVCQRRLGPLELIPIVSFLFQGGRCRGCGARIGWRTPAVELATGLIFGLIYLRFGWSFRTVQLAVFSAFLVITFVTDLESKRILNVVILPGLAIALVFIPITPGQSIGALLLGGGVGFAALFLLALIVPHGMGMGDVKLAGFVGLIVGYPLIVFVLAIAFLSGGAISVFLLLTARVRRDQRIAFGPFLSGAAIASMLYGSEWVAAWIRRLG
jgi:leader peptidase (prepilin peptidase)/N-methyltransferase